MNQTAPPPARAYVSFMGPINNSTMTSLLVTCSEAINRQIPELHLLLSTAGGFVESGIAGYTVLRGMPFTLVTHNTSNVDSIGVTLFLAGAKRYASKHARFNLHGVSREFSGPTHWESAGVRTLANSLAGDNKRLAELYAERTALDFKGATKLFKGITSLDADAAKSNGMVHEIAEVVIEPGMPFQQLVFA